VTFSQSIKNENSPQSLNVQGSNNEINYNVMLINEKLLDFFLNNDSDLQIDELINSLNTDSISDELMIDYTKGVLNIYETLYRNSHLIINDTIKSSFNGNTHIFDIGVHTKTLGHEIILVFKLLPIDHKAEILDVIHFLSALKDLKVAKGIIICNGGFSESVIKYAKSNSIDLCTFKDAESKKWNQNLEIPVVWIKSSPLVHSNFIAKYEGGDKIHKDFSKAKFSYDNGNNIFTVYDIIYWKWENNEIPHVTDSLHITYINTDSLKTLANFKDWRKVDKLEIYYTTREEYFLRYFKPEEYEAIENYLTHDVQFTKVSVEIEVFNEDETWIKIGEDIKDDNSLGEKIILPEGLSICVTATIEDLSKADFNMDYMNINRIEK
jgi:hypothetical protein